ncbi:MAG: hypothetical protein IPK03_15165 [Bacteroidetes bacterium]|nr:hypothetical protein [Bacteroidota bacterium]
MQKNFKGGKKTNDQGTTEYVSSSGYSCTLKVTRQGYKPKSFAINIGKETKEVG